MKYRLSSIREFSRVPPAIPQGSGAVQWGGLVATLIPPRLVQGEDKSVCFSLSYQLDIIFPKRCLYTTSTASFKFLLDKRADHKTPSRHAFRLRPRKVISIGGPDPDSGNKGHFLFPFLGNAIQSGLKAKSLVLQAV